MPCRKHVFELVIKAQRTFKNFAEPSLTQESKQCVGPFSLQNQLHAVDSVTGTFKTNINQPGMTTSGNGKIRLH